MAFTLVEFNEFHFDGDTTVYIDPASVKVLQSVQYMRGVTPVDCVRMTCTFDGSTRTVDVTNTMHQVVQILSGV